jgi:carotenoid cleavage dioxygenase-like enzyme
MTPAASPPYACRYIYATAFNGKGEGEGLVKIDLASRGSPGYVSKLPFGAHTFGGEALFVPRREPQAEDDGYLITYAYSHDTNASDFRVYDASTMDPAPVARVLLPRRVPYGEPCVSFPLCDHTGRLRSAV